MCQFPTGDLFYEVVIHSCSYPILTISAVVSVSRCLVMRILVLRVRSEVYPKGNLRASVTKSSYVKLILGLWSPF